MAGATSNKIGRASGRGRVNVWPASSGAGGAGDAGYARMLVVQLLTVCGPASSSVATSGPLVKLGGSLTAVIVMVKVCGALVSLPPLAVPPLSLATTVMVAEPLASAAPVKVNVPVGEMAGATSN